MYKYMREYRDNIQRDSLIEEIQYKVSEHPDFSTLQSIVELIRNSLNIGGVFIVSHDEANDEHNAQAEILYGMASPPTLKEVTLRKENVIDNEGLLGKACHIRFPFVWDKITIKKSLHKSNLFKSMEDRIHNALVAPICSTKENKNYLRGKEKNPVIAYLCLFNKRDQFNKIRDFSREDVRMVEQLCQSIRVALIYELMMESATLAIVEALDRRDPKNAEHSRRVANLTIDISKQLIKDEVWSNFSFREVRQGWYAGLLHDVGKIGAPDTVLFGNKELNAEEKRHRKIHPHASVAIVEQIKGLSPDIVRAISEHHEWYYGENGYTVKKQRKDICEIARILCAADTYDSMTRNKGTWRGFSKPAAYAQLLRIKGEKLDPQVVRAFLKTDEFKSTKKIVNKLKRMRYRVLSSNKGIRRKFLSTQYTCCILKYVFENFMKITDVSMKIFKEQMECIEIVENIKIEDLKGIVYENIINNYKNERSKREIELAFLHIRWGKVNPYIPEDVFISINNQASKRHVFPVAMKNGIGILAPRSSRSDAYGYALEFHKAISDGYKNYENSTKNQALEKPIKKPINKPVIGISYVPSKDIQGCGCLLGCSMIASYYGMKNASEPESVSFFERQQLQPPTQET
ncbi:HD-GYP domain-containing protein [Candidatus Latescibacterota bacterium]